MKGPPGGMRFLGLCQNWICTYMLWSYYLVQVWGFWKLLSGPSRGFWKLLSGPSLCFFAYKNSGFKRFVLQTQLSFCVFFFCAQLSCNSLKITFFKKRVQKLGFFNFQCFKLKFWKFSFLGLLKHYENRGFGNLLCFLLLKGRKQAKKNDNWNFWILVFLVQKMAVSWRICCFQKVCWNPYFYSVFRVRAFRAKLSKKGNFGHPPKKKKILTHNWKAHFCGGFNGQVRWPEGPPHLALNPPYLFFFFCFLSFLCSHRKTLFFPLKRAFFVYFSLSPFLSP